MQQPSPKSNWHRYLALLSQKNISQPSQRWYVQHVEQFLDHFHHRNVSSISKDEVEAYLERASQQTKLQNWQFKQLVTALQILLVDLVSSDAGKGIDWRYWIDASDQLETHLLQFTPDPSNAWRMNQ